VTSAASRARVSGTYAVTWASVVEVGRCLDLGSAICSAGEFGCFWCRRLGQNRAESGLDELEARASVCSSQPAACSSAQRRTAPACQPEYRPPYTPRPRIPTALHCTRPPLTYHIHNPPPSALRAAAAARAVRRRVPSCSTVVAPPPPCNAHARYTIAACNHHPMLRHNPRPSSHPSANLLAVPLATGIGFGHAACPAI